MEKRKLIITSIGVIPIIIGLIILAIVPDARIKFFVGFLIAWFGILILGYTLKK